MKDDIRIAEELAKELCTGSTSSPLLQTWKEQSPRLYEELKRQSDLPDSLAFHDSINVKAAMHDVHKRIFPTYYNRMRLLRRVCTVAASLLLLVGIGTLWVMQEREKSIKEWTSAMPGKEKASITIGNSQPMQLPAHNLVVKDNRLICSANDGHPQTSIKLQPKNTFTKLDVPAGGEHSLTLEDGTVVQVNSASQLLFPSRFKSGIRKVRLTGEAYFQVKADKEHPFIVQLDEAVSVQVTGTTFNVKAYEEENEIRVVLVEGSIDMLKGNNLLASVLPGQLFVYRKDTQEYHIEDTEVAEATDWMNETFVFRDEPIENIMRKLSRWYNVDITVNDDIKDLRYTGILSRKQPLSETLDALRMTNELDFNIHRDKKVDVQGNRTTIKSN